ncbi:MAG: response regulator [Bdellovibrionales bacterium]
MSEGESSGEEKVDVLLVDDKPENLLSLEEVLQAPDLNFVRSLSGEEALEAVLKCRPALLIMDVQMPGMNGFEVARMLRGMERTRHIPIIFVTATHREERFSFEGFESGAVDYLFKPLNHVVVRSKVRVFVELHRKSVRLEQYVNQLSLLNRELETFSYSVSHDLRAPVRSMMGFARNALEALDTSLIADAQSDLKRVVAAGERMNRLIDALLDLARLSRIELKKSRVDISEMARQICEDLRRESPGASVAIEIMEGITAYCDKRLMDAALRNLLGNAFKFSSRSPSPKVEFGTQRRANETVYFVRDNGTGFDMAYADRLFAPFQRLHTSSEFEGTGVGLATVKRIINRHQGTIWPESIKNEGTVFFFTLSES